MIRLEKFVGFFTAFTSEFLSRLDRNLNKLAQENGPYAIANDYIFTEDDQIDSLQVDATAANRTIYLPASPTGNRRRRVIKTDSSVNTVTLNGNGSLINGATSVILATQYDYIEVEPTGVGWLRIE